MQPVRMLRPGDAVGLLAPAGPAIRPEHVTQARAAIETFGLRVVVGPSCAEKCGYLAGSDDIRAGDLHTFFADPQIAGMFCMRGGYGSLRILDRLDFDMIARHPKVFVGYSDITALHLALARRAGFITFHGPMPASDFIRPGFETYARQRLKDAVMSAEPLGDMASPEAAPAIAPIAGGQAEGRLIGGNLSLICALMGTPFEIDTRGKILLLEDIGEETYRLDRMLTHLRLAGTLAAAAGIVIGEFTGWEAAEARNYVPVRDMLVELLRPLGIPVLLNLCCRHGRYNATLPLGALARIDGDRGRLIVTEAGVRK